ncbi:MAG: ECF transporter S component [Clostridiaceae bacterium]
MKNTSSTTPFLGVRQITTVGMLSAISVILGLTGYGFIPLPVAKATIMHVPVIIGAILEGPKVGILIGLMFGAFSLIQNIMSPNLLSFAFLNPLVSVLPRALIGLTAYYSYKLVKSRNEGLRIAVAAAVGSLTNTIGVLGMIYLLYAAQYAQVKGIAVSVAAKAIFGIAFTNGLAEAVVAVIISIACVMAVKKIRK